MDKLKLIDIIQMVNYYLPKMNREEVQEVLLTMITLIEFFFQKQSIDEISLQKLEDAVKHQKQAGIHGIFE